MTRRDLLKRSAAFGLTAGFSTLAAACRAAAGETLSEGATLHPLTPPTHGPIPVAFVVSEGAVVIDFAGPWAVFQDVHGSQGEGCFQLYTVAETTAPVRASAGLMIVPDFTFQTAPAPKVVVLPAQGGKSPAMLAWIRTAATTADVTMSVCTGAFLLAQTGLLSGKGATTHHNAYTEFAMQFPDVQLQRGARFVEDGNLASSGGLSAGIDLALRVVERYYGRARAAQTADMMEYQGQGWLHADSNQAYSRSPVSTDEHPLCPVCSMDGDRELQSEYQGKTYYFCSPDHKVLFDRTPDKFVRALAETKS